MYLRPKRIKNEDKKVLPAAESVVPTDEDTNKVLPAAELLAPTEEDTNKVLPAAELVAPTEEDKEDPYEDIWAL